jgi:DNA polymerase-3 subunit gamma/tau
MTSQVFYRKWRPQSLAEIVGQEHVTRTLLNALSHERVSHAYLFCGPRGTGKTTTARWLAKAVNCLTGGKGEPCNNCAMCRAITEGRALDVIEVDAASNRGIDEIRDLREKVNYAPNLARRKVYIIDEVHMLSKDASNALLKTLEEPPPHVIFVLATTEAHKLLPTIISRCQRFDFHRHTLANTVEVLSRVCEGEDIHVDAEALKLIARAATGSLRDAMNLLQQLNTLYGREISLEHARALLGISGDQRARELVKHIIAQDTAAGIATINNVNSDGLDLRQFSRDIVEDLRRLLLIATGSVGSLELTVDDIKELKELAAKTSTARLLRAIKRFGQLDLSLDNYSTLPLELALVDCTLPETEEKAAPVAGVKAEPPVVKPAPKADHYPATPGVEARPVEKKDREPVAPEVNKPAVPPPASRPVSTAENTPAIGSAIEQLQLNWTRIIRESPDGLGKTAAAALLRSARPLAIEDDILVVSVKHQYHKEKMDILENQRTVDKIASSFLGRSCRVRCVYEHENNHLVKAALDMGAQVIDGEGK